MSERGRNKFSNDAAGVCLTVPRPALGDAVMLASRAARAWPRPVAREDGEETTILFAVRGCTDFRVERLVAPAPAGVPENGNALG